MSSWVILVPTSLNEPPLMRKNTKSPQLLEFLGVHLQREQDQTMNYEEKNS